MLAFFPALEKIRDAQIKLRRRIDVVGGELIRLEDRDELCVRGEHWVRPQVRGDFLRFTLLDGGVRSLESVIVLQRQLDRLIERYAHGAVYLAGRHVLRRGSLPGPRLLRRILRISAA